MQKSATSDVDADMIDLAAIGAMGVEKDEITISKIANRNRSAASGLIACGPGEPKVHRGIAVIDESGTVEAVRSLSCITIGVSIGSSQYRLKCFSRWRGVSRDRFVAFCGTTACSEKKYCKEQQYYTFLSYQGTALLGIPMPGFHGVVQKVVVVFTGLSLPWQVI